MDVWAITPAATKTATIDETRISTDVGESHWWKRFGALFMLTTNESFEAEGGSTLLFIPLTNVSSFPRAVCILESIFRQYGTLLQVFNITQLRFFI